jgi:hypothetical protein
MIKNPFPSGFEWVAERLPEDIQHCCIASIFDICKNDKTLWSTWKNYCDRVSDVVDEDWWTLLTEVFNEQRQSKETLQSS